MTPPRPTAAANRKSPSGLVNSATSPLREEAFCGRLRRAAYKMSTTLKTSPSTVNFTLLLPKSSAYTRAGSCW